MGAISVIEECLVLMVKSDELTTRPRESELKIWFDSFASDLLVPVHYATIGSGIDLKDWFDAQIKLQATNERRRLLLGGFHLEDAITFVGLEGLVQGFDVFLLADLIDAQDPKFSEFHWHRLFQAGGVPTTMSQMLAEWKTSETCDVKALKIVEHSNKYHQIEK